MSPFEVMGLPETASAAAVKARWRELARQHHPDTGGNADKFDQCRKAYAAALREAQAPKTCESCQGQGKKTVQRGFSQVRLPCEVCGGSGAIERADNE